MKHTESNLQAECVKWFRLQYPMYARLLFAIPNGGARNVVTGSLLKAEGVVAGVPDLMLAVKGHVKVFNTICAAINILKESKVLDEYSDGTSPALFIEMKAPNGKVTPRQAEMHKLLTAQGYEVVVCYSFDDFKQAIEDYLR